MSLNYVATAAAAPLPPPALCDPFVPTTHAGKRPRPAPLAEHPSCKRPRRVSTPSSAISAVTAGSDRSAAGPSRYQATAASFDLPSPAFCHPVSASAPPHAHAHSPALSLPLPLTPPSPPTPADEHDVDVDVGLHADPVAYDDTDDQPCSPGSLSPPSSPGLEDAEPLQEAVEPDCKGLRSDAAIAADAANSFCTGQTGLVEWTNELLVHVLATDVEDLCAANAHPAGRTDGHAGVRSGGWSSPVSSTSRASVSDSGDEEEVVGASDVHVFFSQHRQPFELDFYIRRLIQFANCSSAAFIVMLVYLDRVQQRCPALLLTDMNCHRLLCTALVLAIKYLDDEVFSNAYYARVGGVTADEMNDLELKMLSILRWDLSVKPDTFALYEEGLVRSAALVSDAPASASD